MNIQGLVVYHGSVESLFPTPPVVDHTPTLFLTSLFSFSARTLRHVTEAGSILGPGRL